MKKNRVKIKIENTNNKVLFIKNIIIWGALSKGKDANSMPV